MTFLTADESRALIDAAPRDRWEGRRDRAMLTLAIHSRLASIARSSPSGSATPIPARLSNTATPTVTIKERALALLNPPAVKPGRYTPSDEVLAYPDSLG